MSSLAQTKEQMPDEAPLETDSLKSWVRYGDKGFEFETLNRKYLFQMEFRLQTRIAYPYETDPITFTDFGDEKTYIGINRARWKVGGHAGSSHFKYYFEYELFAGKLLDFRIMLEKLPFLNVKVGQWKAHYNRERIISSGKQQTLERSILTYAFTIDRQQGMSLFGRANCEGALDFNYWLSIFTGNGRGAFENDDENLMYMGRLQWNAFGDPTSFSGSDIPVHSNPSFILAIAATTNISPYTRFSTSGGGQLDGFEPGVPSQYKVDQWVQETAFKFRGFSWQQEYHWKRIDDRVNSEVTILSGALFQAGYFFNQIWDSFPKELELFGRYAYYDPSEDIPDNFRKEITAGVNWFFNGHRNKVTLEFGHLDFQDDPTEIRDGSRGRFQWDVSF